MSVTWYIPQNVRGKLRGALYASRARGYEAIGIPPSILQIRPAGGSSNFGAGIG